jgi:hypothetical protein
MSALSELLFKDALAGAAQTAFEWLGDDLIRADTEDGDEYQESVVCSVHRSATQASIGVLQYCSQIGSP